VARCRGQFVLLPVNRVRTGQYCRHPPPLATPVMKPRTATVWCSHTKHLCTPVTILSSTAGRLATNTCTNTPLRVHIEQYRTSCNHALSYSTMLLRAAQRPARKLAASHGSPHQQAAARRLVPLIMPRAATAASPAPAEGAGGGDGTPGGWPPTHQTHTRSNTHPRYPTSAAEAAPFPALLPPPNSGAVFGANVARGRRAGTCTAAGP
jgi:hypothetical protein